MSKYGPAVPVRTMLGAEAPDVYNSEKKELKKMGWFTRWFDRKCRESWERARDYNNSPVVQSVPDRGHRIGANGLDLSIYSADGGTVLEFRNYDIRTDRNNNSLHVISQSENFEERVAQAITMELLRQGMTK